MTAARDRLLDLLPAVYRRRDGEALEQLLAVAGEQVAVLEENIAQLYDDLFIETCAPWVVPYIGDLVGARGVHPVTRATAGERAYVANTVAYRRRKGTAAMLEQLAHDITDWNARAVEFFVRIATTQYMARLRPGHRSIPSLGDPEPLSWLSGPFDDLPHTVNVRRIGGGRGRHNIPNVGIFLWRWSASPATDSPAVAVDGRRYRFSPLGIDVPLVTLPRGESDMAHIVEPLDAPIPIGRLALHRTPAAYYGRSLYVEVDGAPVDVANVVAADLSDLPGGGWAHVPDDIPAGAVAVDPVLGRLAFADDHPDRDVVVSFHVRGTAAFAGGEYTRLGTFTVADATPVTTTIADAVASLGTTSGAVELPDSGRYAWASPLVLAPGQRVEVRAADGRRPVVELGGELRVEAGDDSELVLNGLLVTGGLVRIDGPLRLLAVRHCTLVPSAGTPAIAVDDTTSTVEVEIDHSVTGPLHLSTASTALGVRDSVIDSPLRDVAVATPGEATFERATVLGSVRVRMLARASDSIFLRPVHADRRQAGCVRFSRLPADSRTPPRHRCTDDRPRFVSLRFGSPGYAEVAHTCCDAVRTGASTGSEMGAFSSLLHPLREANLRARLDEFVRFSVEAGVLDAT